MSERIEKYTYINSEGKELLPESMTGKLTEIKRFSYGPEGWMGYNLLLDTGIQIDLPASAGQYTMPYVRIGDIFELEVSKWQDRSGIKTEPNARDVKVKREDEIVNLFIASVDQIILV